MTLLLVAIAWLAGVSAAALGVAWLWPVGDLLSVIGCVVLALTGRRTAALWCVPLALVAMAGALRFEAKRGATASRWRGRVRRQLAGDTPGRRS